MVKEDTSNPKWYAITDDAVCVELESGEKEDDVDFVNTQYGCIEGCKFEDKDGNAATSDDQVKKVGWLIKLYKIDDKGCKVLFACTLTDESGRYKFEGLKPGTYVVKEDTSDPKWYAITADAVCINLKSGEKGEADFVNTHYACIEGCKFEDTDGNSHTTEDQIKKSGWLINLYKIDEKGCEVLVDCTLTDENGCYKFENLEPGKYIVREDTSDPKWYAVTEDAVCVQLESGEKEDDVNFVNAKYGCVEGNKYYDADRDGKYDEGEKGVGGWKISLYQIIDGKECFVACTYTDENGAYKFGQLKAGDYKVVEHGLNGWDSNGPHEYCISVKPGEKEASKDFFNFKKKACVDIEKLVSVDGGKTWWDADCKTGPVADKCDKILYKIVVKNTGDYDLCNVTIVDAKLGIKVTLKTLEAGSSWDTEAHGKWSYGHQTNTATVTANVDMVKYGYEGEGPIEAARMADGYYEHFKKSVSDTDDASYHGINGVCSSKYWLSKVGKLAWDGKANPKKYFLPRRIFCRIPTVTRSLTVCASAISTSMASRTTAKKRWSTANRRRSRRWKKRPAAPRRSRRNS